MPVLGRGGIVQIKRNAPGVVELLPAAVLLASNNFSSLNQNYVTGDLVRFVSTGGNLPIQGFTSNSTANFYIYVDDLDRVSLYSTKIDSYSGSETKRIPLAAASFTKITCSLVIQDWATQGYLEEWSLSLDASEVDTTAIGDKFGENLKNIISGGGNFNFLAHRRIALSGGFQDSMELINLFFFRDNAANVDVKFYLDRSTKTFYLADKNAVDLPGTTYYQSKIIITQLTINTRADDIIAGTANFVTTGPIYFRVLSVQ
jgi:hypothetical protein